MTWSDEARAAALIARRAKKGRSGNRGMFGRYYRYRKGRRVPVKRVAVRKKRKPGWKNARRKRKSRK